MTARIEFQDASKGFMEGLLKSGMYLKRSTVDARLFELIAYRVSQINGCAFCIDMHHKDAIHAGESEQRLYSLIVWRETPYFSDQERVVLELAEVLTNISQEEVSDALFEKLLLFFTKAEIADLALAVSLTNSWNRINKTFGTVPGFYQPNQALVTV
ncbi:carboxymuconolactone decarboxylase family protein [Xanthocytophaga agilis]|uniref:Carboxymuconolactone decarboxylase family protein n=1 Tax=Xanthocytophaga agilis TaxID=3048010 RepID=A0AAE3UDS5_9BACT|nr:carboxymuconolactone decarboxylase family protein [Xanthocytophaga agilis]MDJ1499517.1 carboxymuconolactone decarboxylase family protein [Xanthocytophaga agilis]